MNIAKAIQLGGSNSNKTIKKLPPYRKFINKKIDCLIFNTEIAFIQ